jgi:hypothetical protein
MAASIFHFPTCMWAVACIGYMGVVNRLAVGGNWYLSDAVMTLYYFREINLTIMVIFIGMLVCKIRINNILLECGKLIFR